MGTVVRMTISRSLRRRAAWSVPVVTAAVVGAGALLPSTASASAHPKLPARSAAQLLAAVQTSTVTHLSGEVVETARLGLPSLPGSNSSANLDYQTFATGTHAVRLWVDGPDRQRVAVLGQLAESDVVHSGKDLWTYASATRKVTHLALPAEKPGSTRPGTAVQLTPLAAADKVLAAIGPSTVVTVDPTARVAHQKAYTLVLVPRGSGSTVRKVLIAVDAAHGVPLRVQVFGSGTKPAFETAFQNISFDRPSASVFRFRVPKGSPVTEQALPARGAARPGTEPASAGPAVLGSGWTSVAAFPAGRSVLAGLTGKDAALLNRLTTALPGGGRLLRTALLNALVAADGRMFVGAVTPAVLQQAAAGSLR